MKVKFKKRFQKDMRKVRQPHDLKKIQKAILALKKAPDVGALFDIPNVKKLKNYKEYWRIRAGDYRVGFAIKDNVLYFERVGHRGQFYDYYPEHLEELEPEMV